MKNLIALVCSLGFLAPVSAADAPALGYKAGAASKVITPAEPVWMAGYASRTKPAEGKIHDLYAKALCIEDAAGKRLVLVTTDLIGIPRTLGAAVAAEATFVARSIDTDKQGMAEVLRAAEDVS